MRMNVICASHPRLQGHKHNPRSSLTIIHLGGPVWLTTAEEVSKFLLQCILQQNMNLLANQFLMPAFRALCCVCKKLINEHCSIIPVPSCSLGLIYSVKDCFQAAAGWGIYLWPANFSVLRPFSLFSISWTQRLDWTLEHNIPFDRNSADILHCNIQFTRNVDITLAGVATCWISRYNPTKATVASSAVNWVDLAASHSVGNGPADLNSHHTDFANCLQF